MNHRINAGSLVTLVALCASTTMGLIGITQLSSCATSTGNPVSQRGTDFVSDVPQREPPAPVEAEDSPESDLVPLNRVYRYPEGGVGDGTRVAGSPERTVVVSPYGLVNVLDLTGEAPSLLGRVALDLSPQRVVVIGQRAFVLAATMRDRIDEQTGRHMHFSGPTLIALDISDPTRIVELGRRHFPKGVTSLWSRAGRLLVVEVLSTETLCDDCEEERHALVRIDTESPELADSGRIEFEGKLEPVEGFTTDDEGLLVLEQENAVEVREGGQLPSAPVDRGGLRIVDVTADELAVRWSVPEPARLGGALRNGQLWAWGTDFREADGQLVLDLELNVYSLDSTAASEVEEAGTFTAPIEGEADEWRLFFAESTALLTRRSPSTATLLDLDSAGGFALRDAVTLPGRASDAQWSGTAWIVHGEREREGDTRIGDYVSLLDPAATDTSPFSVLFDDGYIDDVVAGDDGLVYAARSVSEIQGCSGSRRTLLTALEAEGGALQPLGEVDAPGRVVHLQALEGKAIFATEEDLGSAVITDGELASPQLLALERRPQHAEWLGDRIVRLSGRADREAWIDVVPAARAAFPSGAERPLPAGSCGDPSWRQSDADFFVHAEVAHWLRSVEGGGAQLVTLDPTLPSPVLQAIDIPYRSLGEREVEPLGSRGFVRSGDLWLFPTLTGGEYDVDFGGGEWVEPPLLGVVAVRAREARGPVVVDTFEFPCAVDLGGFVPADPLVIATRVEAAEGGGSRHYMERFEPSEAGQVFRLFPISVPGSIVGFDPAAGWAVARVVRFGAELSEEECRAASQPVRVDDRCYAATRTFSLLAIEDNQARIVDEVAGFGTAQFSNGILYTTAPVAPEFERLDEIDNYLEQEGGLALRPYEVRDGRFVELPELRTFGAGSLQATANGLLLRRSDGHARLWQIAADGASTLVPFHFGHGCQLNESAPWLCAGAAPPVELLTQPTAP